MRAHVIVAILLVAGLAYFVLRPLLGLVRLSARLAVWLVLLGVLIAATVLSTQQQRGLTPAAPTYQSREPSLPAYH